MDWIKKYAMELIAVFVALTLFGVFFPQIQTAVAGLGLDNVTIAPGQSIDLSILGYLIVIALVFTVVELGGMATIKRKG